MADELRHPFLCQCQHLYTTYGTRLTASKRSCQARCSVAAHDYRVSLPWNDNTHWNRFSCHWHLHYQPGLGP